MTGPNPVMPTAATEKIDIGMPRLDESMHRCQLHVTDGSEIGHVLMRKKEVCDSASDLRQAIDEHPFWDFDRGRGRYHR